MSNRIIPIVIALAVVVLIGTVFVVWNTSTTDAAATTTTSAPSTTEPTPSTTTTEPADDGFPVTIETVNGPVTIQARPERIVSISPTSTEVLFAVGAGEQVVAVDDQSNYPPEAPMTDLTGFTPNVEAIASYEPDVVFISFDPGDVVSGLQALGIPVIMHGAPTAVTDAYTQWEQVGAATGHVGEAAALVGATSASIGVSIATLPEGTDTLSYYYELDPTFFSVTSSTFVGSLLAMTSMTNIADEADPDGYGFPQLTAEYIIDSDPTLIYLADTKCCGQDADEVAGRPGWDTMTAVRDGNVVELDDDIASRWGPRIADLVDEVVASILARELTDA